jgi:predicted transcriptional regulator
MKASTLYAYRNVKHRCRLDVIATILETAASGDAPKSKIYYSSFFDLSKTKSTYEVFIGEQTDRIF